MFKTLLQQYAAHNAWANGQLLDVVAGLTTAQQNEPLVSSFAGLYPTVLHLLDAESIWWQRLRLSENIVRPSDTFAGSFDELKKALLQQSATIGQWVNNLNEHQLQHVIGYQRSKTEQYKQPVCQVLLHLFNHGSYHRGQLVTMLRQLGVSSIPATDFNAYLRSSKKLVSGKAI
jgi:uncharacterized damage-inducible protein DinB